MADLTKIFAGMEKGPDAIQANFSATNDVLTGSPADQSIDGTKLVALNGFTVKGGGIQLHGQLIIGNIFFNRSNATDRMWYKDVCQLPSWAIPKAEVVCGGTLSANYAGLSFDGHIQTKGTFYIGTIGPNDAKLFNGDGYVNFAYYVN